MHPKPQPQPQIVRREYRRREAQDPEHAKRRAIWRDRQWARRLKFLAAPGWVDVGHVHPQQPRARQIHPCGDEQQARRRKIWRENQRVRRARVRAAAPAADAAGTAAAPVEVSSGCSHAREAAGGKTTVWRCAARRIYIYVADPLAVSLHPHRSLTYTYKLISQLVTMIRRPFCAVHVIELLICWMTGWRDEQW